MLGQHFTSHHTYDSTHCPGELIVTEPLREGSDRDWVCRCDECGFELSVHSSRLAGPREVAPPDRRVEPRSAW